MARWAAGAKWGEAPAPDDQRDTPLVLSLSEGLGSTVHRGLINDFESLTSNEHVFIEVSTSAGALSREVPTMTLHPVRKGPVAFSFNCRKLSADLIEGHDIHSGSLDHA